MHIEEVLSKAVGLKPETPSKRAAGAELSGTLGPSRVGLLGAQNVRHSATTVAGWGIWGGGVFWGFFVCFIF